MVTREPLPIVRACDFNLETLPTKSLHGMGLEIKIKSWSSQLKNSASSFPRQKPRYGSLRSLSKHSIASGLKKRKGQKRLQNRSLLVMKRGILSRSRRAAKRMAEDNPDYENTSMRSTSSLFRTR